MREFVPGRWHVHDHDNFDLPIYDDQGNKPLVFDEYRACQLLEELNQRNSETEGWNG